MKTFADSIGSFGLMGGSLSPIKALAHIVIEYEME